MDIPPPALPGVPMFLVVACPRCRRAKVVEEGKRTTTCPSCSRSLELEHLRVHHQAASPEEARHAAGILNARLVGREADFAVALVPPAPRAARHDGAADAAAAQARRASSESGRADRIARHLSQTLGEFGRDDLAAAMRLAGIAPARVDAHLERMLATTLLFEPRAGRYRAF